MCEKTDQDFEDLKEFLHMIDFEQVGDQIRIVENYFKLEDFPATVQNHIKKYFEYIDTIS